MSVGKFAGIAHRFVTKGAVGRFSVQNVDRGMRHIQEQVRKLKHPAYVKAGILGKAATATRPARPAARIEDDAAAEFAKAQAAVNPVFLAVLAHKAQTDKARPQPTNVELAIMHEFGTRRAPARPFIRAAFAKHKPEYMAILSDLVRHAVMTKRMRYEQALAYLGLKMAADMKKFVTAGPQIPPPNSGYPDTERGYWAEKVRRGYHVWAARRKSGVEGPDMAPRTLVDTGRMVGSITHAVVSRDASAAAGTLARK